MKKFMAIGLVSMSLLVVGCGSKEVDNVVDVDSEVSASELEVGGNGDFYFEMKTYNATMSDYTGEALTLLKQRNETNDKKIIDITNEFLLYSKTFKVVPVTEEDYILYDGFQDLKYDLEKFAEYTLQYVYKDEKVYYDFMKDSIDNINIHLDAMILIENKYYSQYK